MRRVSALLLPATAGVVLLAALWLWAMGGATDVARAASAWQHEVQDGMARALRALRAGEPGALLALWGLCLGYGVLHAAGPGHGKLVVGGYGLARRVAALKLAGLALASSLAQAGTAIALVLAGMLLLGLTREGMTELADGDLAALSAILIGLVGLWLLVRGVLSLWRLRAAPAPHAHVPAPAHAPAHAPADPLGLGSLAPGGGEVCATCGHAHGPTAEQAARVGSWREALAVIAAVAARPCTGALFLLILTWRMGIFGAGVVGALLMALGTAAVTVAAALAAVALRETALARAPSGPALARTMGLVEVAAGAAVVLLAWQMLALVP